MELAALQEYAETRGFEDSIKDFDVEFFKRKQIRSIYGVEEEAQRDFFPLPHVLKGVFRKGSRTRKNINPPFFKFIHNFLTFLPLKAKKKSENRSDVSQKTCFHQDNCVIISSAVASVWWRSTTTWCSPWRRPRGIRNPGPTRSLFTRLVSILRNAVSYV